MSTWKIWLQFLVSVVDTYVFMTIHWEGLAIVQQQCRWLVSGLMGTKPSFLWDTVYTKKYAHSFCFAVLCCGYTLTDFPYPSGLLHWHCGNLTIAPVPAKQPWWIWINTSCEFIMNDCITTTKQSTTKPCAYFLGYTVFGYGILQWDSQMGFRYQ